MRQLFIVCNNVDAGPDRSATDNLPGLQVEHFQFAFIATSKEEASFLIERYTTRTSAAIGPAADGCTFLKIHYESDTAPQMSERLSASNDQGFRPTGHRNESSVSSSGCSVVA